MFLTVLLRCGRSRGAKSSKEIEKAEFLVIPGTESAYFRPERRNPIKTGQSDSETYPNRPSRIDWNQKFRDPFVLWGATCQKSGFLLVCDNQDIFNVQGPAPSTPSKWIKIRRFCELVQPLHGYVIKRRVILDHSTLDAATAVFRGLISVKWKNLSL